VPVDITLFFFKFLTINNLHMPSTNMRAGIDTDVTTDVLATSFVVTYSVFTGQALYIGT